jgi:hypothetical protein
LGDTGNVSAADQSSEGEDFSQEPMTDSERAGKKRKTGNSKDSTARIALRLGLALKKKKHSHEDSEDADCWD